MTVRHGVGNHHRGAGVLGGRSTGPGPDEVDEVGETPDDDRLGGSQPGRFRHGHHLPVQLGGVVAVGVEGLRGQVQHRVPV